MLYVWTCPVSIPQLALCIHLPLANLLGLPCPSSTPTTYSHFLPASHMDECWEASPLCPQNPKPGWRHRCWLLSVVKGSLTPNTELQISPLLAASSAGPFQILGSEGWRFSLARSCSWKAGNNADPWPFIVSQPSPSGLEPWNTKEGLSFNYRFLFIPFLSIAI